jgi:hypothetical protein
MKKKLDRGTAKCNVILTASPAYKSKRVNKYFRSLREALEFIDRVKADGIRKWPARTRSEAPRVTNRNRRPWQYIHLFENRPLGGRGGSASYEDLLFMRIDY